MGTVPAPAATEPGRPSRATRLIGAIATGLGESVGWLAEHGVLFAVFLVIWLGFGLLLVTNPAALGQVWDAINDQPLILQLVLWLLFLPVMAGLWVWQASGWPDLVRVAAVLALAGWTLLVMKPSRGWPGWNARRQPASR